jgi:endonuclease YncB( thermonuclease family)
MIFGPYKGTVDQVHDGDTVYVRLDLGFDLNVYARCRIYGINAPELSTPEGKVALAFAQGLLPVGSSVRVTSHGWDKYGGRIDAEIGYGDVTPLDFATTMLESGHAVIYR